MKIHEYQAKSLFRRYEIPVPKGHVLFDEAEASNVAKDLISQTGNETLVQGVHPK